MIEKIDRDWSKKMLIPEALEIAEEKYKAIKTLLDSRTSDGSTGDTTDENR